MSRLVATTVSLLALACASPNVVDGGADADVVVDVGADTLRDAPDAQPDAGREPAVLAPGVFAEVVTSRGVFAGEVIARFDRTLWTFSPEARVDFLLFDDAQFADFPDDRSTVLINEAEVLQAFEIEARTPFLDVTSSMGVRVLGSPLDGTAYVFEGNARHHLTENGYGDFAWDLTRLEGGSTFRGEGTRNEDYLVFGQSVSLPVEAYVVDAYDAAIDRAPGTLPEADDFESIDTNYVGVHLYGDFYLYLFHLRQGSIPPDVREGAVLPRGTVIGEVGNSGYSLAPHLHVVAYWDDTTGRSGRVWSVPIRFDDVYVSSTATDAELRSQWVPSAGEYISSETF